MRPTDFSEAPPPSIRAFFGGNIMFDRTRSVHILIFDQVEVLDFCGPFEVFSVAGRRDGKEPFEVHAVASDLRPIQARGGLSVNPAYSFDNCPGTDILVIPGGPG